MAHTASNDENRKYAYYTALGSLFLASTLTECGKNDERNRKKHNVVNRKIETLRASFPEYTEELRTVIPRQALKDGLEPELITGFILKDRLEPELIPGFMIDLVFSNPFAPSELKYKQKDFVASLRTLGIGLSWDVTGVDRIVKNKNRAMKAHRNIPLKKLAMYGVAGAMVMGAGGWFIIAPAIGTYIGAAAGLYGIAATSHGLAILGGGSLALGGSGMAGGMWLIASTGAVLGLGPAGISALINLGSEMAKMEIIKLQVAYKEMIVGGQIDAKQSLEIESSLVQKEEEMSAKIEEAREFNENNAICIKEMEAIKTALTNSIKWIKKEKKR